MKFLRTTNIHEVGTLCTFPLTVAVQHMWVHWKPTLRQLAKCLTCLTVTQIRGMDDVKGTLWSYLPAKTSQLTFDILNNKLFVSLRKTALFTSLLVFFPCFFSWCITTTSQLIELQECVLLPGALVHMCEIQQNGDPLIQTPVGRATRGPKLHRYLLRFYSWSSDLPFQRPQRHK